MSTESVRRIDWIVGGLALVLLIVLLELPWYTAGGGTINGISLPSISEPATGSPGAVFGLFGVIAVLAVLFDLVFEHVSPDTNVPALKESRTLTRVALAGTAAFFLALKFIFNLSKIGNFGVGCWLGLVLVAALVYATEQARRQDPGPHRHPDDADEEEDTDGSAADQAERSDRADGGERDESERSARGDREQPGRSARDDEAERSASTGAPQGSEAGRSEREPRSSA